MSRAIKADFETLLKFIDEYSIASLKEDEQFRVHLSQMHKKYYAFMALVFELENITPKVFNPKQSNFLLESVSDVGNSLFLAVNGAYKPARLMLRSSIETFLKGFIIDQLLNVDQEKRINKIFEDIKALPFFINQPNRQLFDDLNDSYAVLCEDTHTARKSNMQHTSSLNYFPQKSLAALEGVSKMNKRLISTFLTLLCLKFNNEYHKIHHKNKQIILDNILKKYRPSIMNTA